MNGCVRYIRASLFLSLNESTSPTRKIKPYSFAFLNFTTSSNAQA